MRTRRLMLTMLFLVLGPLWVTGASAQTVPTPQFDFLGFIQEATLDPTVCGTPPADPILHGGTMTVNGVKMVVPCNTILQFPASSWTWAQLFNPANSAAVGAVIGTAPAQVLGQTGLALADNPLPFPSFEVRAVGNVVNGKYIVGLIAPITQQGLNSGAGLVNCIDYVNGSFRVGGTPGDCATGALVQLNDPDGRFGLVHSPDRRFTADTGNPTMFSSTGYPVCIPRVAPPTIDLECPIGNRPLNNDLRYCPDGTLAASGCVAGPDPFLAANAPRKMFHMPAPGTDPTLPDATKQVPIMVGDWVIYQGTLFKIDPALPGTPANTYVSAHTIDANLGIFTSPGAAPAYVVAGGLIGAGGAAVQGIIQEATTRLFIDGFTTDPTRLVDIYAVDVNPCTGQETARPLATTDPATQPVLGRFVHHVLGGNFGAPTRDLVVTSRTGTLPGGVSNGLVGGQYRFPMFDFIFPENHRVGDPIIPNNFQDFPFLAQGSGPLFGTGPVVGQLDPWPGAVAPPKVVCGDIGALPIVNAGPDIAVAPGTLVTLTGTVAWDIDNSTVASRTAVWAQTGGTPVTLTPNPADLSVSPSAVTASFSTPAVAGALTFTLTANDNIAPPPFFNVVDTVNINVLVVTDTVNITAAIWQLSTPNRGAAFGKLSVSATSTDLTALLSLKIFLADGSFADGGTAAADNQGTWTWRELKGVPQPASLVVTSDKGGSFTATCGQPDAKGRLTCQ